MPPTPPADSDEHEGWTDTQLVRQVTGNAGAAGAGAAAELTRRSTDALNRSTEKLTDALNRSSEKLARLTWRLIVFMFSDLGHT
jgi:hypothetical protein